MDTIDTKAASPKYIESIRLSFTKCKVRTVQSNRDMVRVKEVFREIAE